MSNYFRVTAYHENENLSVIIDSNGYFNEIWELSALMIQKGFRVLEVSDSSQFLDGNIDRADKDTENLIVRACCKGKPTYNGNVVEVECKSYTPEKNK
jgi:hypothetical protein